VQTTAKQVSENRAQGNWDWVKSEIWTDRMLAALVNGVKEDKWSMAKYILR